MTILQQHIDFNIGMQKIASNVKRKFLPEEIDWLLNQTINRFVQSKIEENMQLQEAGYQAHQLNLDAIRTLQINDYPLKAYKTVNSDPFIKAELPADYAFLAEDASYSLRSCDPNYSSDFTLFNEYIYSLAIPDDPGSGPTYYNSSVLTIQGVDAQIVFPVVNDKTMKFMIIDAIKNKRLKNVYWERYKDVYASNKFLIIQPTVGAPTFTATGISASGVIVGDSSELRLNNSNYTKLVSNRLVKASLLNRLMQSSFAKTLWESPLSLLEGNTLKVYHDNKFIINKVNINYIRKPLQVSLSLGINCDLPEDFHGQITQLAVEYTKQAIQDPNYPWKLQDNNLRT